MDELPGRPIIFTTGAFLSPKKFILSNGETWWGWLVEEFVNNSYYDGEIFNPTEFASTKTQLLEVNEDDIEL